MDAAPQLRIFAELTTAIGRTRTVAEICAIALDALATALEVRRASVLLFDHEGVMRVTESRGLSDAFRGAVEGHSAWTPASVDAEAIVVADVSQHPSLAPRLPGIRAEAIAAMAFIPICGANRVLGEFMICYDEPHAPTAMELDVARLIALQVGFAVERTCAEEAARRSETRLRFALEAAAMGTWDWDLRTNAVQWSDNLEVLHGLQPGAFAGSFDNYEREIHPDDRAAVFASIQRALADGVPHEVEYRLVGPDGTIRWCEGKGRVEYLDGTPVRMTGVCMMVTRRKEAELARLGAAEEASRLKDEFLATLSHELRTPLNAILGWVQMLERAALPPERMRQAIDVIARNATLQSQLIEDILDVSRIIAGKLEIERSAVNTAALIDGVVQALAPEASSRSITLRASAPTGLPSIDGDAKRLHQVLSNVVSNALKFTGDGGRVDVACRVEDGSVLIEVRDSGIGIAPEFLPYVFDRFRQADSGVTRTQGGLGLGLSIARHLVALHDGTIRADSAGVGRGTTITIVLPALPGSVADLFDASRLAAL